MKQRRDSDSGSSILFIYDIFIIIETVGILLRTKSYCRSNGLYTIPLSKKKSKE